MKTSFAPSTGQPMAGSRAPRKLGQRVSTRPAPKPDVDIGELYLAESVRL